MNRSLEGLGVFAHEFSMKACKHSRQLGQETRHEDLTLEYEGIVSGPDFVERLWFLLLTKLAHEEYPARVIGEQMNCNLRFMRVAVIATVTLTT